LILGLHVQQQKKVLEVSCFGHGRAPDPTDMLVVAHQSAEHGVENAAFLNSALPHH
jgi:hypothetical protein